jgi:hypothetical protein
MTVNTCQEVAHIAVTFSFWTAHKVKVNEDVVRFTIERVLHDVLSQLKVL